MGRTLRGKIFSGTGEGAHYTKLYSNELTKILGTQPYPGTLNVLLDKCFYELIEASKLIRIPPPKQGLGAVYAYRGYLAGVPVLILKPTITTHECRVVEVVSHVNLRRELGLRDGDVVELVLVE